MNVLFSFETKTVWFSVWRISTSRPTSVPEGDPTLQVRWCWKVIGRSNRRIYVYIKHATHFHNSHNSLRTWPNGRHRKTHLLCTRPNLSLGYLDASTWSIWYISRNIETDRRHSFAWMGCVFASSFFVSGDRQMWFLFHSEGVSLHVWITAVSIKEEGQTFIRAFLMLLQGRLLGSPDNGKNCKKNLH